MNHAEELVGRLQAAAQERFGHRGTGVALAPGRVNLIGEHVDYNDGFVFPMAIDRYVAVAFRPRTDRVVRVHSLSFNETWERTLDEVLAETSPERSAARGGWSAYVRAMMRVLAADGVSLEGMDAVFDGSLPRGGGLSSSAALELAFGRAFLAVAGAPYDAVRVARAAQRAENEEVGVSCGIMDQLASACGVEGSALLIDCRSLDIRPVPVDPSVSVVIMDTGVRRALGGTAYNDRRSACERAVAELRRRGHGVTALRDVSIELLASQKGELEDTVFRRARHVVGEIARAQAYAAALAAADLDEAGRLMNASHESLRGDYEVSSAELDLATDLARAAPGCLGARLTGAGFGGCAVALVRTEAAADFVVEVERRYRSRSGQPGSWFRASPVAGAKLLPA